MKLNFIPPSMMDNSRGTRYHVMKLNFIPPSMMDNSRGTRYHVMKLNVLPPSMMDNSRGTSCHEPSLSFPSDTVFLSDDSVSSGSDRTLFSIT